MAAPVVFVLIFTVEGALRPGYDPASMFVSELSLGARGWVQSGNFLLSGLLVVLFARGVSLAFGGRGAAGAAPVLLWIIGGSLIASGAFATDPSALFDQVSAHGVVHGLFGALVFSLAPVTCFVCYNRFRRNAAWRGFTPWTLLAGLVLVASVVALKASQFPQSDLFAWKGLVQRVFLICFMAWLFAFAACLARLVVRARLERIGVVVER